MFPENNWVKAGGFVVVIGAMLGAAIFPYETAYIAVVGGIIYAIATYQTRHPPTK